MDEVAGGGIRLTWDEAGRLHGAQFGAADVKQPVGKGYRLNGQPGQFAGRTRDAARLTHYSRSDDGSLTATWTGGDSLTVTIEASGQAVRGAGFVLDLPRGDFLSLVAEPRRWDTCSVGDRICFSDFPFGVGQMYLLDLGCACLRFGRQVQRKRDYPTGWLERTAAGWRLTWLWEAQLPYPERFISQPLQFRLFPTVDAALNEHRAWGESTLGWLPHAANPRIPDWFRTCPILFQLNLGETNGAVLHDFRDVALLAEDLHRAGVPEGAIIYIPDYNPNSAILRGFSGPLAVCWPDNPLLGGKREFAAMLETARRYGYHILPHGNLVFLLEWSSRNFGDSGARRNLWRNPAWDWIQPHAIRTAAGHPIGWPPDEAAEKYPYMCRYVNLGVDEVRSWFLELTSGMIREFDLDAFYFDSVSVGPAISYQGNIPRLAEIIDGERRLLQELQARHPHVLFAGELCDEDNVDLVPLWQERSAISHALFGPYIYTFAHTVVASPLSQRYSDIGGISHFAAIALADEVELSRRQPNNIPRLLLNYRDHRVDEQTQRCIRELLACRDVPVLAAASH